MTIGRREEPETCLSGAVEIDALCHKACANTRSGGG